MEPLSKLIENQYNSTGLYEEIIRRLEEEQVDLNSVARDDIAGVDEFHVRGAEVSEELASQVKLDHSRVLDVGCGLGGPSRMLADKYQCHVTGIDLNQEYIRTAQGLSDLVGLREKTEYIRGDALDLPFETGTFDVVWTQHVQMNIHHKLKFYSEIERVLTSQGTFLYYDIFCTEGGGVNYPVLWADEPSSSFLVTPEEMDDILERLCFKNLQITDQTENGKQFLIKLIDKLKANGPPKLGLDVLMGSSTKDKLENLLKGMMEGEIVLQSGIYVKRAIN